MRLNWFKTSDLLGVSFQRFPMVSNWKPLETQTSSFCELDRGESFDGFIFYGHDLTQCRYNYVRPSVRPSVRKNTVILRLCQSGHAKSRWSFASSNKNTFHTFRALQPGLQSDVYPLSTATTPSSQFARHLKLG